MSTHAPSPTSLRRALQDCGGDVDGGWVSIWTIADELDLPRENVRITLATLEDRQLVVSRPQRVGGSHTGDEWQLDTGGRE